MILYHYITKGNTALSEGILSLANNPKADLHYYYKRTGGETTHEGIVRWMESCFTGRSRTIRGFSEPIKWTEKSEKMFKDFIEGADLFAIDVSALDKDGLIEAVWAPERRWVWAVQWHPEFAFRTFADEAYRRRLEQKAFESL